MEREALVDRIEANLAEAGIYVDVGLTDEGVLLAGIVATAHQRALAEELAGHVAEGKRIENNLDVEPGGIPAADEEYEYLEAPFDLEAVTVLGAGEDQNDDTAYFAPTDPVLEAGEVVGGFEGTSMDSLEVEPSASDDRPGDEALAEAVRRELREDAATIDLPVEVAVERGVVHLSGRVLSLDDVGNAEEVAGRLPGVREVIEELDLAGDEA